MFHNEHFLKTRMRVEGKQEQKKKLNKLRQAMQPIGDF